MNRLFFAAVFSIVIFANCVITLSEIQAQGNRVELEVVFGNDVDIEYRQQWAELLANVGADSVRVRSASGGDKISVTATPNGDNELCKMVGQITRRNQLALPGGTFSRRDVAGIKALIQKVRDDGAQVALSEKKAFGLTAVQLVELHKELSGTFVDSTKGTSVAEIVSKIHNSIGTPLRLTEEAKEVLREDYLIEDEMSGLSHGTVLAAVLRPLGLVSVPQRPQGGEIHIAVMPSDKAEEHWPVGWPNDKPKSKTAPELYDSFSVRIENYGLRDVLDAIEKKAHVPFLYDYNSLAEKGLELNDAKVTLIEEKIGYLTAAEKLLRSSKMYLKAELRIDENGKPFLWITTQR